MTAARTFGGRTAAKEAMRQWLPLAQQHRELTQRREAAIRLRCREERAAVLDAVRATVICGWDPRKEETQR